MFSSKKYFILLSCLVFAGMAPQIFDRGAVSLYLSHAIEQSGSNYL
jgi:hypothetical protein